MKSGKTEKSLVFLRQALAALPQDNALLEARNAVRLAINRIENVEQKRVRREEASRVAANPVPFIGVGHTAASLELIDRMIATEEGKLPTAASPDDGGADGPTLFG